MARLNLTLDAATHARLAKAAREGGAPQATVARELLAEALDRRERAARRRRLAADYSAGRRDAQALLRDLEAAGLELLE